MNRLGYLPGRNSLNNVTSFLERHLKSTPDKPLLKWVLPATLRSWDFSPSTPLPHEFITVQSMENSIGRLAQGFLDTGIRHGDRVLLFVPMSLQLYLAMFALQRIGAAPVFLDSWARRSELGSTAKTIDPHAMISFEKAFLLCSGIPELASVPIKISVGESTENYSARLEELLQSPRSAPIEPVEQEETALITFTTGSSGVPKGANRTHRFLAAQHYAISESIPYQPDDIDLPVFPIFSLNNMAGGVTTVLPAIDLAAPTDKDGLILYAQMMTCRTTCTTLSPSLLNKVSSFCKEMGLTIPGLRRGVTGGAPISRDNTRDFVSIAPNATLMILYGSTEVEPMSDISDKEMLATETESHDPEWVDEGVNVGHLVRSLRYKFIHIHPGPIVIQSPEDWGSLEVKTGDVGELIVAGEHVCRDYYNNAEATARSKIKEPDGTVWHRTGDLGRLDERGNLWIVGRVHNVIRRGSGYVFPVRAEVILRRLPFVRQAAYLGVPGVPGVPDSQMGEKAVCVIVPHEDIPSQPDEWRREISRVMSKNKMPVDEIIIRDSIPMDPRHHSKVEYDLLRTQLVGVPGSVL